MTLRPKLMILGDARHGKDTAAEWLKAKHGYRFVSSSWFMCERVVFPAFAAAGRPYETPEKCFADRSGRRQFWYETIAAYNANDPARLTKAIFAEGNDMYVGLRNARELHAGKLQKAYDLAIWIDASLRVPREDRSSNTLEPWMADVIVDNNGTLADLDRNMEFLYNSWIAPLEAHPSIDDIVDRMEPLDDNF